MNTRNTQKFISTTFFVIGMLFVCCLFLESWRSPFFFNSHYKGLKFILSVIIPFVLTIFAVTVSKGYNGLKFAMPIITAGFFIHYFIDTSFIGYIATFGDFCIIYHLIYATIAFFTVISTASILKQLTNKKAIANDDDFISFYKSFLICFTAIIAFDFVAMFFLYRTVSSEVYYTNLIPFKGEFQDFLMYVKNQELLGIIHTLGNLFFFIPFEFIICSVFKNKKRVFSILIPIGISVLIELSQLVFNNGFTDIDDVIFNSIGSILGFIYYLAIFKNVWEDKKCLE